MLQATIKPTWDAFGFQSDLEDSQPVKQTASQRQETQQKKKPTGRNNGNNSRINNWRKKTIAIVIQSIGDWWLSTVTATLIGKRFRRCCGFQSGALCRKPFAWQFHRLGTGIGSANEKCGHVLPIRCSGCRSILSAGNWINAAPTRKLASEFDVSNRSPAIAHTRISVANFQLSAFV